MRVSVCEMQDKGDGRGWWRMSEEATTERRFLKHEPNREATRAATLSCILADALPACLPAYLSAFEFEVLSLSSGKYCCTCMIARSLRPIFRRIEKSMTRGAVEVHQAAFTRSFPPFPPPLLERGWPLRWLVGSWGSQKGRRRRRDEWNAEEGLVLCSPLLSSALLCSPLRAEPNAVHPRKHSSAKAKGPG